MNTLWPSGLKRIPDEVWTRDPIESLATNYDNVKYHGWYRNLDITSSQLLEHLHEGQFVLDYSGGTGILEERLLQEIGNMSIGVLIADASPKFLRLALEKFKTEERIALRLIKYIKDQKRLQYVDEVIDMKAFACRFDYVLSTNAIHLYYDLPETISSWVRVLKPGGIALVQSGNIRNPAADKGLWLIDETVESINKIAVELVKTDPRYAQYRSVLDDPFTMEKYEVLRNRYFLPIRPLTFYLEELRRAGFKIKDVMATPIEAKVSEWYQFLSVYHEGVLGWVGGVERILGRTPSQDAVADRLHLIRAALNRLFEGRENFNSCWTFITCSAPVA
jgi:ubiquinone/menaquinone biosynthesis C-methylase UbiE